MCMLYVERWRQRQQQQIRCVCSACNLTLRCVHIRSSSVKRGMREKCCCCGLCNSKEAQDKHTRQVKYGREMRVRKENVSEETKY